MEENSIKTYKIKDIAERFQVSKATVKFWVKTGELNPLPPVKKSADDVLVRRPAYEFTLEEIERFVLARRARKNNVA